MPTAPQAGTSFMEAGAATVLANAPGVALIATSAQATTNVKVIASFFNEISFGNNTT